MTITFSKDGKAMDFTTDEKEMEFQQKTRKEISEILMPYKQDIGYPFSISIKYDSEYNIIGISTSGKELKTPYQVNNLLDHLIRK